MKKNKRKKTIKIAIFNHKGGIGKTTLAFNLAASLGREKKKVLMIDSDPQCNLTSYLFEESVINNLLDESDSVSGRTIWSAMKPITENSGKYRVVQPYETSIDNVFLVPGDVKLTNFESILNDAWLDSLARRPRGLITTNALSELVGKCSELVNADYVIYDTGPNIGPLNRLILLDCDYFIVPAAYDLFSIRALNTLGQTIDGWIKDWKTISTLAPDEIEMMKGKPEFLGYVVVKFGQISDQRIQSDFAAKLERRIGSDIIKVLSKNKKTTVASTKLGIVSDYRELILISQHEGVPLADIRPLKNDIDIKMQKEAKKVFETIAKTVVKKAK